MNTNNNVIARIIYMLFGITLLYHATILFGIVPLEMCWGGRLKTSDEMYVFESLSILSLVVIALLVAIRVGHIKVQIHLKVLRVIMAFCALLFLLNIAGNLQAINIWEKVLFTPITAVAALLFAKLAVSST